MTADRQQLQIALAASGLNTYLALARATGINRSRLSLIVNGWVEAREAERRAIATAVGVSVGRIFRVREHAHASVAR